MLTGKCEIAFEKWFIKEHGSWGQYEPIIGDGLDLQDFYCSTKSMQYGVYVDWFDSVMFEINIYSYSNKKYRYELINKEIWHVLEDFNTRHEARTEAIKKANQIYNEKHSN